MGVRTEVFGLSSGQFGLSSSSGVFGLSRWYTDE